MSEIDDAMNAEREAEINAAYVAFEVYARAKRNADATLTFAACHDAAQAWVRFVNLYLSADLQMPTDNVELVEAVGGAGE
ncbi:MAG: hypothetical protein WBA42_01535 [Mesorhizobium sp.]